MDIKRDEHGCLPEGIDDPNWELAGYVQEVTGDLEFQEILPERAKLPQASVDGLRASLENAKAELARLDAEYFATLK